MYDIVRARSDLLAVADALQAGRPDDRASHLKRSSQADPWSWPLWGAQAGATPQGPAIWSLFEKLFYFFAGLLFVWHVIWPWAFLYYVVYNYHIYAMIRWHSWSDPSFSYMVDLWPAPMRLRETDDYSTYPKTCGFSRETMAHVFAHPELQQALQEILTRPKVLVKILRRVWSANLQS